MKDGDWRASQPRFSEENLEANAARAQKLAELAAGKQISTAQLALAWLLQRARDMGVQVCPIPGTKTAVCIFHWVLIF